MPVSNPSYFPPERGNGSVVGVTAGQNTIGARQFLGGNSAGDNSRIDDLVVIGYGAMSSGTVAVPITDTTLAGTVVVGVSAAEQLIVGLAAASTHDLPNVITGFQAAQNARSAVASVISGAGALGDMTGSSTDQNGSISGVVVIGANALGAINPVLGNNGPPADLVVIGIRAAYGSNGTDWNCQKSVIIGAQACEDTGGNASAQITDNVVIGYQAARNLGAGTINAGGNVILGSGCASGKASIRESVVLGFGNTLSTGPGGFEPRLLVCLGSGARASGVNSVVIGGNCNGEGNGNIYIGYAANTNLPNQPQSDTVSIGNDNYRGVYINMARGNTVLGNSITGANLSFGGTGDASNALKLLNGGKDSTSAPTNGGFFYCDGGANGTLHWVQTDGTDNVIAGTGGGASSAKLGTRGAVTAAAGSQNNVAPDASVNIQTLGRLFVNTAAGNATFTGLSAGYDGQLLWVNVAGGNTLTLNTADGSSTAANQFSGSANLTFNSGDNLLLCYDGTLQKWLMGV